MMGMSISAGGPEHIYESEVCDGEITAAIGPREEIIRCRECKWFKEGASPHDPSGTYNLCTQFSFDFQGSNGFCAWAERDT